MPCLSVVQQAKQEKKFSVYVHKYRASFVKISIERGSSGSSTTPSLGWRNIITYCESKLRNIKNGVKKEKKTEPQRANAIFKCRMGFNMSWNTCTSFIPINSHLIWCKRNNVQFHNSGNYVQSPVGKRFDFFEICYLICLVIKFITVVANFTIIQADFMSEMISLDPNCIRMPVALFFDSSNKFALLRWCHKILQKVKSWNILVKLSGMDLKEQKKMKDVRSHSSSISAW